MPVNRRHVVPAGPGEAAVKRPGNPTPGSTHRTQGAAERAAKQDPRRAGGEGVTHGHDGRIRDADTVAPGRDPLPPHDTRRSAGTYSIWVGPRRTS